MSNAIQKLKSALGVHDEAAMVMTVVSENNGIVQLQGSGRVLSIVGAWQIGTRLIVRSGVVESVVVESGVVVFED